MVTPALQLAPKISDIGVQLWGTAILKHLHRMLGEKGLEEAHESYTIFGNMNKCTQLTG